MRLTIWHHDRYPTAPGVYLECFPRRGHEITWVTFSTGAGYRVRERRQDGVRRVEIERAADRPGPRALAVLVNRWRKLRGFALKVRVLSRLAAERPDVLQVRELVTEGLLGLWFARRRGIPFAFQFDYPHYEARLHLADRRRRVAAWLRLTSWWWIHWRNRILRSADLVLPISEAMAERLHRKLGIPRARLEPFPVGVSRETLRAAMEGAARRPQELAGHPLVCYMGNLAPIRGPELLFRIWERVAERMPEARFLLVGEVTPEAEAELAGSPIRPRIHTTGFRPREEVLALLRGADVGVFPLPTRDPYGIFLTSSPLKVVEYMSCELPVVASKVADAVTLLEESGGGVCVDNEPGTFADAVVAYLRDPERARRDGSRGRAYVERQRTFDALAGRIEGAYRRRTGRSSTARGEVRWAS